MTDGLATGCEVILYNGRGVASSSGMPRTRFEQMADDAAALIRALELPKVDLSGDFVEVMWFQGVVDCLQPGK